jgi:hypothetical protein
MRRKYPAVAHEAHVRQAGVAVGCRQVVPETSMRGDNFVKKSSKM